MKFSFRNIFSASLLRITTLSFSCFLYIYGVSDVKSFASDAFSASHEKHKDFLVQLKDICDIKPACLGGTNGMFLGVFVSNLKDKKNIKLVSAIKYVHELTEFIVEQAKKLKAENEESKEKGPDSQGASSELLAENKPLDKESDPMTSGKAKLIEDIKQSMELIFEAHLILYIALKGFLLEQKGPKRPIIVNTLKSIVSHSFDSRGSKFHCIKISSFYKKALDAMLSSTDTFKNVFAKECCAAKASGNYLSALHLALESRLFCADVVNTPELRPVISQTKVDRTIIFNMFPDAVLETRSLLAGIDIGE